MSTPRRAGWAAWVVIAVFASQALISAFDGGWAGALPPAVFIVGFAGQLVLGRLKHPTAANAVLFSAIVGVFVVSIVQRTWSMVGVLGVGLLALAGIWAATRWVGRQDSRACRSSTGRSA